MSRRSLSDQRHLLVELELDESMHGDWGSTPHTQRYLQPSHAQPHYHRESHADYEPRRASVDRPARPQSATVRRSSTTDQKNSSPYKLKQKILSSRSRTALDRVDDYAQPSQPLRRAAPDTTASQSSPLRLIADAIRQNIAQRQQLLMELQDELQRVSALYPLHAQRSTTQQLIPSTTIKMLNRLRSVTLSIIEMIRYFHEQLPSSSSSSSSSQGDATLWALRHEFQHCVSRLCASDVDCLLSSPAIVNLFESLGANALRNPLLDGVSLDSSELLLCSCQSLGASSSTTTTATNVASSSLFRLVVSRLEAFAIHVRQVYPAWQVLPHDRVARALLELLASETKANATRLLPSYLRSDHESVAPWNGEQRRASRVVFHGDDDDDDDDGDDQRYSRIDNRRLTGQRRPSQQIAAVAPVASVEYENELIYDDDEDEEKNDLMEESWLSDPRGHRRLEVRKPSLVAPIPIVQTPPVVCPAPIPSKMPPPSKSLSPPSFQPPTRSPAVEVAEPKPIPTGSNSAPAKNSAKKAKKLTERSLTVGSFALKPPTSINPLESERASLTAEAKQPTPQMEMSSDDRLRATIASALDKLPQFSLHTLGMPAPSHDDQVVQPSTASTSALLPPAPAETEDEKVMVVLPRMEPATTITPTVEAYSSDVDSVTSPSQQQDDERGDNEKEDDEQESEQNAEEEETTTGNASALSHIMSLCRDVQVAAIDLHQRLHYGQANADDGISTIYTPSSPPTTTSSRSSSIPSSSSSSSGGGTSISRANESLGSRYLERELKMLRRFLRLWQRALALRRERLHALRVASAVRCIARFARHLRALRLSSYKANQATRIQRQWRAFRYRQVMVTRRDQFQLLHRCFKRCCFFVHVEKRRRQRQRAQLTLQRWWRRLHRAHKAQRQRQQEHEQAQARRSQAARQLQGFVRHQLLHHKLTQALAANRSLMMKEQLKATRVRQQEEKKQKLESKRRAEMRVAMQQSLREMEARWKEAEAANETLRVESETRRLRDEQLALELRRQLARGTIDRFLERTVLKRRLRAVISANEEIARAKNELEMVRLRLERRQREDEAKRLLQGRMLWWKMDRVVAQQRDAAEQEMEDMEWRRREERAAMKETLRARALQEVAHTSVASVCGLATGVVIEKTYRMRLRAKRKEARQLRRQAARERIAGFVWLCWTRHLLSKAEKELVERKNQQEQEELRVRVEKEAQAKREMETMQRKRATSAQYISVWLRRQLAQRKEAQRLREETLRVEAERRREQEGLEAQRQEQKRLEILLEQQQHQQRLLEIQRRTEWEREQVVRVQLVQVMLATQHVAARTATVSLTQALCGYTTQCEQLTLAARVRLFYSRLLVRKVGVHWRQFALRRRILRAITRQAMWAKDKSASSTTTGFTVSVIDDKMGVLDAEQRRALRLFELKCIASARKVQRCWRAWHREMRRQRRLQTKAHEDSLVAIHKHRGSSKRMNDFSNMATASTTHTASAKRITRWLRSHIRHQQLTKTITIPQTEGESVAVYFRAGRAWVRSCCLSSPSSSAQKTRVRLDRVVTRRLLLAMDQRAIHSQKELLALYEALASDVCHCVLRTAATSPRATYKLDGWLEISDVGEMDLPQFCQLTRQLTKTQSLYKRQQLLDAKLTTTGTTRSTPVAVLTIFDAVDAGSVDDAQFLLQQGVDLHVREPLHQRTALHMLAFSGAETTTEQRLQLFQFLVERARLDLHARDDHGDTPLMLFAVHGCVALVQALLQLMSKETVDEEETKKVAMEMATAMRRACEHDQPEVALLLQCHAMQQQQQPPPERLASVHRGDASGATPLHVAAMRGHVECLRQLLTPLDLPSRRALFEARESTRGCTPLHVAVDSDQLDAVTMLLEMGADVSNGDGWQCSPLHYATRATRAMELISSLHAAAETCHAESLFRLADERGDTALHWAAACGRAPVVRHLLVLGADPTGLNSDWETPAHVAAARGHGECLRLLLPATCHPGWQQHTISDANTTPVRDVNQELPSPKSYCHPQYGNPTTSSSATAHTKIKMKLSPSYDWDEIHQDVQLVDESGHFSSEDECSDLDE